MRHLTTLIIVLLAGLLPATGRTYMLAVGINRYADSNINQLHLCVHDAEVMQWLYQQNQQAETRLLTNEQATRDNIVQAAIEIFSLATAEDQIVFFFSGHGSKKGLYTYDQTLPFKQLRDIMAASQAGQKMIFADACFSGRMRRNRDEAPTTSGLANFDFMLFLSSRSGETSKEMARTMRNGLFTAYLQRGLRGGADKNGDRTITAREIFEFVSQGVKEASGDKQHPVMWGHFDNDMPIMTW